MIRRIPVTLVRALVKPCWCGRLHRRNRWHDPTHGAIDRDIQERARAFLGIPPLAWHRDHPALHPTELELQRRRDRTKGGQR